MPEGENALVKWLQQRLIADPARVPVGIGDDMALVRLDHPLVAVTADMLLDGVHFETTKHPYELIGRKAIACSLSDCAGMACEPRAATVSLALNSQMSLEHVKRLYEGMAQIAGEFNCPIVGGDTTSWPGRLAIDVALWAEPMSPQRGPVCRSGARAGDTIFVTGPLGGSLAGRHLTFTPRLDIARQIVHEPGLHAMMDISDGLAMDLHRLCDASACDADLFAEQLDRVISDEARHIAQEDGRSPRDHALSDGEDFELLVVGNARWAAERQSGSVRGTARSAGVSPAHSMADERLGLLPVGRIVPRSEPGRSLLTIVAPDGGREPVEPRGFEHFR